MDPLVKQGMQDILAYLAQRRPDSKIPHADGILIFWSKEDMRITEKSLAHWKEKKAEVVIISGRGIPEFVPAEYDSGAEHFASKLVKSGIPESAIITEGITTKTVESVHRSIVAAEKRGIYLSSLIVCAKPYHLRRIRALFANIHPRIKVYGSAFPLKKKDWERPERMERILNEITRIELCSFITVPGKILKACDMVHSYLLYTQQNQPEL